MKSFTGTLKTTIPEEFTNPNRSDGAGFVQIAKLLQLYHRHDS
jgi:hypothetical protein